MHPLPAGFYTLGAICKELAQEDHVVVRLPEGLENRPIFLSSSESRVEPFLNNLARAYGCSVLANGGNTYRFQLAKIAPPEITVTFSKPRHQTPLDEKTIGNQLAELARLEDKGQAYGVKWNRIQTTLFDPISGDLAEKLTTNNLTECGQVFFSEQPNNFEFPLGVAASKQLSGELLARWKMRQKIAELAKSYPAVAEELGLKPEASPDNASLVIEVNTSGPEARTATVALCQPDGRALIEAEAEIEQTKNDVSDLKISTGPRGNDQLASWLKKDYENLGNEVGPIQPPTAPEQAAKQLANTDPLEWAVGPALKQLEGRQLFVRLPDAYFTETYKYRHGPIDTAALLRRLMLDPYVKTYATEDAYFVVPNGSPQDANVDRETLQANLSAWPSVSTTADFITRAENFDGPWQLNPESVLAPVLMGHRNQTIELQADGLRLIASFGFAIRDLGSPSSEDAERLFRTGRWNSWWLATVGQNWLSVPGSPGEFVLSRLIGGFDSTDRVVAFSEPHRIIGAPQSVLIGHTFLAESLASFAAFRSNYASDWQGLSPAARRGSIKDVTRWQLTVGKPGATGLCISVDLPEKSLDFDVLTLEGLPDALRQAIEQALPADANGGQKPR